MSLIWEDPAPAERHFGGTTRPKSETRQAAEAFTAQLFQYPGKWARLWNEPDEKEARKKEQTLRSCAEKGTLKVVVRETPEGAYAVFAMAKEPSAEEASEAVQEPLLGDGQGQGTFA